MRLFPEEVAASGGDRVMPENPYSWGLPRCTLQGNLQRRQKMKKPYSNTSFSTKRCITCGSFLKKNLLAKKPNAEEDFKCWYPKEIGRRGGVAFTGRTEVGHAK